MKIQADQYRVREGETVKAERRPTRIAPIHDSETSYKALLAEHVAELDRQQQRLYAADRHAVLFIFQAMDAAGKTA